MKILVFLEQRAGSLKPSSLEALSAAATLSGGQSANVAGVLIGEGVSGLAEKVRDHGADTIFVVDQASLKQYNVLTYLSALEKAVATFAPDAVLGVASPLGRDLFARAAARLKAPLLTDLVEILGGTSFTGGVKPMFAGKVLARVQYKGTGLKLATLRPNVFPITPSAGKAAVQKLEVSISESASFKTVEIRKGKNNKADLTEASRIISGGRALGKSENFSILHECADVIGATVGASRAAVDSGYASHDMQVGQTGKTVNPNLYIACGISGSIQHMAGMRTSKVVVAINTDPDAPIMSIANYGIIADLFEAVPIMTKKLKEIMD